MNKYLIGLTIFIIFLVGFYYLIFTNPESRPSETPSSTTEIIKIGLTAPLSGEKFLLGESSLAAAQLAVKEINDAGGINERSLKIIFEDDQCSKDGGIVAMTKLVVVDQVTAVISSTCVDAATAASQVAQVASVPMIISGIGTSNLTKDKDFIFHIYPTDLMQGKFAADYFKNNLSMTKAAIVFNKDDQGQDIYNSFVNYFKEVGGKAVYEKSLATDFKDFKTVASQIKNAKPEVVYLALSSSSTISLLKQIQSLKIKTAIFGYSGWEWSSIINAEEAEGSSYFKPKGSPVYDSVKLLAEVMRQTGSDKKSLRNFLVEMFGENREAKNPVFDLITIGFPIASSTASSTP